MIHAAFVFPLSAPHQFDFTHPNGEIGLALVFPRSELAGNNYARAFCQIIGQLFAALSENGAIKPDRAFLVAVSVIYADAESGNRVSVICAANNGILAG